jgi:hypothetical protein
MGWMTRKGLLTASFLLGAFFLLQAQDRPNQDGPKPGTLELTVTDSKTGQPVGEATVELVGGSTYHARSDAFGHVSFPRVEPGRYRILSVQVDGYGYVPDATSSTHVPIVVAESAAANVGTVAVTPLGMIRGAVTDEAGRPIIGAEVVALRYVSVGGVRGLVATTHDKSGITDGQGQYRIHHLAAGRYYVRVSLPPDNPKTPGATRASTPPVAFAPVYYPNANVLSLALRIDVPLGTEAQNIDFRLRPGATFHMRGSVSGLADRARALATVRSHTPGVSIDGAFLSVVTVQADGAFDVPSIPPGEYILSLEERDRTGTASFAIHEFTVIDRDLEGIRLTAVPPTDIWGMVKLDENGASLQMPNSVSLRPADVLLGAIPMGSVDKTNGTFRLAGLLPIDYRLNVSSVRTGSYIKSIKLGSRDISGGKFNIAQGSGTLLVEIGVARGRLNGRVDFGIEKPPGGIRVTVAPDGPLGDRADLTQSVFTNERGEFQLSNLAPGNYRVLPWEQLDADLAQSPEFLSLFRVSSVKVGDGESASVEVKVISILEIEDAKVRF